MKRVVFILCLCLLAGGCKPREQKEDASPTEQSEPVILTLAEEPESVVCAMRFEIKPAKVQKVYRDIPLSHELQDAVDNACEKYRVSPEVLYAVMETESGYQMDAQNGQCIGLMQIHTINLPYL